MLLTRSPLSHPRKDDTVRLACLIHAASVRPEPGSNSPSFIMIELTRAFPLIPTLCSEKDLGAEIWDSQEHVQTKSGRAPFLSRGIFRIQPQVMFG